MGTAIWTRSKAPLHLPPRVLVLDGHCDAAVTVTQSLGRAGALVTVAAKDPSSLACRSRFASRLLFQPYELPDKLMDWLHETISPTEFDLAVPTTEASLIALRKLPESDPLRARCLMARDDSLDAALDKSITYEVARSLGVRVPRTRTISDMRNRQGQWEYPTVLKPVRSKFAHDGALVTGPAQVVCTDRERAEYLQRWLPSTPVLEQEYVVGRGLAISVLAENGRIHWYFAHQRIHEVPVWGGPSSYRKSVRCRPDWLDQCVRLLTALSWHGVAMVEFKYDSLRDELVLMEINPRLWGSLALAVAAGIDFPLGMLHLALGRPLPPQPAYRHEFYCRNIIRDIQWFRARQRLGENAPPDMPAFSTSVLEFARILTGREAWDHVRRDDLRTAMHIAHGSLAALSSHAT